MDMRWIIAIEWIGMALAFFCSLVPPPFTLSARGTVDDLQWTHQAGSEGCACQFVATGANFYYLAGQSDPAGPGPHEGQTVEVVYLDGFDRAWALSVTTDPGQRGSVTYSTPEQLQFDQGQPLHYAAFAGLIAALLLAIAAGVAVWRRVTRVGARAGAWASAASPFILLGAGPLVCYTARTHGVAAELTALSLVWVAAAVIAIGAGLIGRRRDQAPVFARRSMAIAGAGSGVLLLWWAGAFIDALGRAMY